MFANYEPDNFSAKKEQGAQLFLSPQGPPVGWCGHDLSNYFSQQKIIIAEGINGKSYKTKAAINHEATLRSVTLMSKFSLRSSIFRNNIDENRD